MIDTTILLINELVLSIVTTSTTVVISRKYPYEERVLANHSKQLVYHTRVLRAAIERVRARFEQLSSGVESYHFVPKIPRDQCLARSVHA